VTRALVVLAVAVVLVVMLWSFLFHGLTCGGTGC
jgi:hypothetical protein